MEFEMRTKFAGRCVQGHAVEPGTLVRYDRDLKPAIRSCPICRGEEATSPAVNAAGGPASITVKVQRIRSDNGQGWIVADVLLDASAVREDLPIAPDVTFPLVGQLGALTAGDLVEAYGAFEVHPRFGVQYKARQVVQVVGSSIASLRSFLAKLPQVGDARARAIIQAFDSDRARILEAIEHDPEALTVVSGITSERAQAIQEAFLEAPELREVHLWLAGLMLGPALEASILDQWGKDARVVLTEDPYQLVELDGVGFRTADDLARTRFEVRGDDPRRAAAAVLYLLQEEELEGHTWTPLDWLLA